MFMLLFYISSRKSSVILSYIYELLCLEQFEFRIFYESVCLYF